MLASTFWENLGMGAKESIVLAFIMTVAFGINIAGLVLWFSDRRIDFKKALVGLVGHIAQIILFFAVSGYALATMP